MPLSFPLRRVRPPLVVTLIVIAAGCAASARPPASGNVHLVTGALLDDGSCRVVVDGAPLFAATDTPRTVHVAAAAVNLAPPGYELDEIACSTDAGASDNVPTLPPDRADERALLLTIYVPRGERARTGRYVVRGALAADTDTSGIATRAAAAVFGARLPDASHAAGIPYLEAREGTLTLTRLDGAHAAGTFALRATTAWTP